MNIKTIGTVTLMAAMDIVVGVPAAHAGSFEVSSTAPVGYTNYDLTPYVGESDFTIQGVGSFVGTGPVYAAGDNTQSMPFPRAGSDTIPYIAVQPGGGQTFQFSDWQTTVTLELYSPDCWNIIAAGSTIVTGAALTQFNTGPEFITINGYFNEFTVTTPQPAAEFSFGHVDNAAATPELSTWAMMLVGFAGLGYAARRRVVRQRVA